MVSRVAGAVRLRIGSDALDGRPRSVRRQRYGRDIDLSRPCLAVSLPAKGERRSIILPCR